MTMIVENYIFPKYKTCFQSGFSYFSRLESFLLKSSISLKKKLPFSEILETPSLRQNEIFYSRS